MIELKINLWDVKSKKHPLLLGITTNAIVKSNGRAIMGAGVAKEALIRYPGIDLKLGNWLSKYGNVPGRILDISSDYGKDSWLFSFPTKNDWRSRSSLELIEKSAMRLRSGWLKLGGRHQVVLPRPGCGLGGQKWSEVKPILEKHFTEDLFAIISR